MSRANFIAKAPDCTACRREKESKLHTGEVVCSWCPRWVTECEARMLLTMPLHKRRDALDVRLAKRGSTVVLKDAMAGIHAAKRDAAKIALGLTNGR